MRWPFLTHKVHELELDCLRATLVAESNRADIFEQQAEYWRTRAERLTDASLVRAGAIHEPTMVERKPPATAPGAVIAQAMSVKEIDSRQR